jgi:hypothetical protein
MNHETGSFQDEADSKQVEAWKNLGLAIKFPYIKPHTGLASVIIRETQQARSPKTPQNVNVIRQADEKLRLIMFILPRVAQALAIRDAVSKELGTPPDKLTPSEVYYRQVCDEAAEALKTQQALTPQAELQSLVDEVGLALNIEDCFKGPNQP